MDTGECDGHFGNHRVLAGGNGRGFLAKTARKNIFLPGLDTTVPPDIGITGNNLGTTTHAEFTALAVTKVIPLLVQKAICDGALFVGVRPRNPVIVVRHAIFPRQAVSPGYSPFGRDDVIRLQ